jgi:hypothetical protein
MQNINIYQKTYYVLLFCDLFQWDSVQTLSYVNKICCVMKFLLHFLLSIWKIFLISILKMIKISKDFKISCVGVFELWFCPIEKDVFLLNIKKK